MRDCPVGMNPNYRRWTAENWKAYAPTVGHMADKGWRVTAHCWSCSLGLRVNLGEVIRRRGRSWSPWGASSPCPRIGCSGTMGFRAVNGKAEGEIWL